MVYLKWLLIWYHIFPYVHLFKDRGRYLATDLTNARCRFGSDK